MLFEITSLISQIAISSQL